MASAPLPSHRGYTGIPHTWLVVGLPVIGWLVGAVLVVAGPLSWWANYLVIGAVWGLSLAGRQVMRESLKSITREFGSADVKWSECFRDAAQEQWDSWQGEPLQMTTAYLMAAVCETLVWPVLIPLGIYLNTEID